MINPIEVDVLLDDGRLTEIYDSDAVKRGREEARMFVQEFRLRYPAGGGDALIAPAIAALNALPVITAEAIRQQITLQEQNQLMPVTTPQNPVPQNGADDFLQRLARRRGAYHWAAGTSTAFTTWINGPSPLEYPLSVSAQINCWEAVLVAAAEAGLVPVGSLRGAYLQQDKTDAVFRTLTAGRQVNLIVHPQPGGANQIRTGDVIMIAQGPGASDERLHHVVAAMTEDLAHYEDVEVMSLWSAVGGASFARTKLGNLLPPNVRIRYVTL